jgi:hypothetical protein
MKTKKIKHSDVCLEAHQGVGRDEGFTCVDNCGKRSITSDASYTPGPWSFKKDEHDGFYIKSEVRTIADVRFLGVEDRTSANAHLIAAAPELLEAAKTARNVLAALVTGDLKAVKADSPALLALRTAITKAEGK